MKSEIRDITLAPEGRRRIEWARQYMPVLGNIRERFHRERPLEGLKIALSIHLEAKTANLAIALAEGGAQVFVTGSNPLSTQDPIAAALADQGFSVFAWHGATDEEYKTHLIHTLSEGVDIVIDDGGDLVDLLHGEMSHLAPNVLGGCEETTTGVHRLRGKADKGILKFPMIAVNDAKCKHLFDNRYGTGQSVLDGIMRTTNLLIAGKTVVVAGYGWCGKGVAMRAKGMGAQVVVTEIDPVCAIEAVMDGFRVMSMDEAAAIGDLFVTVTGCCDVITGKHFAKMKNGALLSNAGHFDVEVSVKELKQMAVEHRPLRNNVEGYLMPDGRVLCLLAEGRLVNLAAGDGHPVEIMDLSFAVQALCAEYIAGKGRNLAAGVYDAPKEVDDAVADVALRSMGITIDSLNEKQRAYLSGDIG